MRKRKGKRKKGTLRRVSKNDAETKFRAAAELLIEDGRLDECVSDPVLDAVGIDFVLHKRICPVEEKKKHRISLHLQIKQARRAANEHCERYPGIPVFVIPPKYTNLRHIAEELWALFCEHFREGSYGKYLAQRSSGRRL